MKNFIINKKNKLINTSLTKGLYRVWILPKMPESIYRFHNHILVRIFRVLGGICFLIMITNIYKDFPLYFKNIINIFAFIQTIWIVFISFTKFFYGIYILICHPYLLEVRNSPLNKAASSLAKIAWCGWTGACAVTGTGVSLGAGGLTLDTILESAGYKPVFKPLAKDLLDFAHKNTGIFTPNTEIDSAVPDEIKLAKGIK